MRIPLNDGAMSIASILHQEVPTLDFHGFDLNDDDDDDDDDDESSLSSDEDDNNEIKCIIPTNEMPINRLNTLNLEIHELVTISQALSIYRSILTIFYRYNALAQCSTNQ
jgi:hypothetical protein